MGQDVISLFPYIGGKTKLTPLLIAMICDAYNEYAEIDTFIEACGGGGRITLNLPHHGRMIYNEFNPCLTNLFQVISTTNGVCSLIDCLEDSTIFTYDEENYKELYNAYKKWALNEEQFSDSILCAAYTYYLTHLSFRGRIQSTVLESKNIASYSSSNLQAISNKIDAYHRSIGRLFEFPCILDGVEFRSEDVLKLLVEFNDPKCLLYIDPPYLKDSYIPRDMLDDHGLVLPNDYYSIKELIGKGDIPVHVKRSSSLEKRRELEKAGKTPIDFCSEIAFDNIMNMIKNVDKDSTHVNGDTRNTLALLDYNSACNRLYECSSEGALRGDYATGFTLRNHLDFITRVKDSKAKIMISGYDNSIYKYLFEDSTRWRKML